MSCARAGTGHKAASTGAHPAPSDTAHTPPYKPRTPSRLKTALSACATVVPCSCHRTQHKVTSLTPAPGKVKHGVLASADAQAHPLAWVSQSLHARLYGVHRIHGDVLSYAGDSACAHMLHRTAQASERYCYHIHYY